METEHGTGQPVGAVQGSPRSAAPDLLSITGDGASDLAGLQPVEDGP
jgi:hypothetical protein